MDSPIPNPLKTEQYIRTLITESSFSVTVKNVYLVGSRGCPTGSVSDSSDVDLFITIENKQKSEEELKLIANTIQTELLWENYKEILRKTGFDIPYTKRKVDLLVYPYSLESDELTSHMEHGGYQNVYSLTNNEYLY